MPTLEYAKMDLTSETFPETSSIYSGEMSNWTIKDELYYDRYGFLQQKTSYAVPVVTLLAIASVAGTFGNILILIVACSKKIWRNVEASFIVNLALSDLYVTIVADPMSLIGRKAFFLVTLGNM